MKSRYFKITGGPVMDQALAFLEEGETLRKRAIEIAEQFNSQVQYYQHGYDGYTRLAGFAPKLGEVNKFDTDLWRRDQKTRLWRLRARPVDKAKSGALLDLKEMLAPIVQIPQPWAMLDSLQEKHGISNGPLVLTGNRARSAGFSLTMDMPYEDGTLAPIIFVTLPWPDTKPGDDNMTSRFKDRVVIPEDWVEVKQWEMLRDLERAETAREAREAA